MEKKYMWLNPVIYEQYHKDDLEDFARKHGFLLIHPKKNAADIVRKKVERVVKSTGVTVVDSRCPMAVEALHEKTPDLYFAPVEPILIHIARELSQREELSDGQKWIITPCKALAVQGTQLQLKNTKFMTWLELIEKYDFQGTPNFPEASPIPPGFYSGIDVVQESLSGDEIFREFSKDTRLVEALYCPLGCHNGDGVKHET